MKKRFVSFLLVISIIISITSFCCSIISSASAETAVISVESKNAAADSEVRIVVNIKNNPGIASAKFTISFDSMLTLIDAENGGAFDALNFSGPRNYTSPCSFSWNSESVETAENGTVLTLSFKVSADAEPDSILPVEISYHRDDIYNYDLESVAVAFESGSISVVDYIPGDVNRDLIVNGKDVTLLRRYIVGGYDVYINETAADVNDDGVINGKDITLLRQYNAGGYSVTLKPSSLGCKHNLEHFPAKDVACTEDGNIEYWYCTKCGRYFTDSAGKNRISPDNTVIKADGHTFSDEWSSDSTHHWHSAVCEHTSEIADYAEHTFVGHKCSVCGAPETDDQEFTVRFVDFDNSIIDIQTVKHGHNATAPDDPVRKNYSFIGWDNEFNNVVSDLIIKAQYIRQYSVTFIDYDGTVIASEVVNSGESVIPPQAPVREGYTFDSWDQSYENIGSDKEITALYKINRYTVTFINPDGTVIAELSNIAHGAKITPPETADIFFDWSETKGYRFTGWKNWDKDQPVVGNMTVTADYSEEMTDPIIAVETKEIIKGTTTANLSVYLCGSFENIYGMYLKIQYAQQLSLNSNLITVNSRFIGSESALDTKKGVYELSWADGQGIDINERLEILSLTVNVDKYTDAGDYDISLLNDSYIIDGNLSKITPVTVVGHIIISE